MGARRVTPLVAVLFVFGGGVPGAWARRAREGEGGARVSTLAKVLMGLG